MLRDPSMIDPWFEGRPPALFSFRFDPTDYTSFWVGRDSSGAPVKVGFTYAKSWWRRLFRMNPVERICVNVEGCWFEEKDGCRVHPISYLQLAEVQATIAHSERETEYAVSHHTPAETPTSLSDIL